MGFHIYPEALARELLKATLCKRYMKDKWPKDSQNPVPIPFLIVSDGQGFISAIGWWSGKSDQDYKYLQNAKGWLVDGLMEIGAGTKISSGYGFFQAGGINFQPGCSPERT